MSKREVELKKKRARAELEIRLINIELEQIGVKVSEKPIHHIPVATSSERFKPRKSWWQEILFWD